MSEAQWEVLAFLGMDASGPVMLVELPNGEKGELRPLPVYPPPTTDTVAVALAELGGEETGMHLLAADLTGPKPCFVVSLLVDDAPDLAPTPQDAPTQPSVEDASAPHDGHMPPNAPPPERHQEPTRPSAKAHVGLVNRARRGAKADATIDELIAQGWSRLLTAPEEIELAQRIEAGVLAQEALQAAKILPLREARDLTTIAVRGHRAYELFARCNHRLVVDQALKLGKSRGLEIEDAIQEGQIGLLKALHKFDHARGNKFSTYATWWLRQSITRAGDDQGRLIRIPVHMAEQIRRLSTAERSMAESGVEQSDDELAEALGVRVRDIHNMRGWRELPVTLDVIRSDPDADEALPELALGESLMERANGSLRTVGNPGGFDEPRLYEESGEVPAADARYRYDDDEITDVAIRAEIRRAIDALPERSAVVITMRFGLTGDEPRTLDQIGKVYGVTRERIRQIETRALGELRALLEGSDLVDELGIMLST